MDNFNRFADNVLNGIPEALKENAEEFEKTLFKEKIPKPKSIKDPPKENKKKKKKKKKKEEVLPEDFSRLDIRIGKIVRADTNLFDPSKPCYLQNVDIGEDVTRLALSDLEPFYELEDLRQRKVVVACNVKKKNKRSLTHQAWLLCANNGEKMELLTPPYACDEGDQVTVEGYPAVSNLRERKRVQDRIVKAVFEDLKVDGIGIATYRGLPLRVEGKHTISTPTLRNCSITDGLKGSHSKHACSHEPLGTDKSPSL